MRVLIAGGSGFIGSAIARRLREALLDVALLDIVQPQWDFNESGIRYYAGDVQDETAVTKAFADFEPTHVIHNASANSMRFETALEKSRGKHSLIGEKVVKVMLERGVTKMVYASSGAVYGEIPEGVSADESWPHRGQSMYALEKASFEQYLREVQEEHPEFSAVVLRYANVYGPGQRDGVVPIFVSKILSGEPVPVFGRERAGDDGCLRDFIYIDDVVQANVWALISDVSGVFNVSSGKAVTTADLLQLVRDSMDHQSDVVFKEPRPLEIKSSALDPSRIRSSGWRRTKGLAQGVDEVVRFMDCAPSGRV